MKIECAVTAMISEYPFNGIKNKAAIAIQFKVKKQYLPLSLFHSPGRTDVTDLCRDLVVLAVPMTLSDWPP